LVHYFAKFAFKFASDKGVMGSIQIFIGLTAESGEVVFFLSKELDQLFPKEANLLKTNNMWLIFPNKVNNMLKTGGFVFFHFLDSFFLLLLSFTSFFEYIPLTINYHFF
jgi:hypothetical protein